MRTILQRYTFREMLSPMILGLFVFTFILFTARLYRLVELLVNQGVSPINLLSFLACLLPYLLSITVPMALLVGILMGFGRLAGENEVMAIRTSGVNLLHLCWPVLAFALLLSIIMIVLNFNFFPHLALTSRNILVDIEFDLISNLEAGQQYDEDDLGETIEFSFRSRDPKDPEILRGISIKYVEKGGGAQANKIFITANEGRMENLPEERKVRLTMQNVQAVSFNPSSPNEARIVRSEEMVKDISPKKDFKPLPRDLPMSQLLNIVRSSETRDRDRSLVFVEIFSRFSVPLACLAFALFAIPLAIIVRPRGKAASYGFAIGLIFFYYVLMKYGASLGPSNIALAGIVIISPNLILMGLGVYMMRKTLSA